VLEKRKRGKEEQTAVLLQKRVTGCSFPLWVRGVVVRRRRFGDWQRVTLRRFETTLFSEEPKGRRRRNWWIGGAKTEPGQ
jgi:hypothetical protein